MARVTMAIQQTLAWASGCVDTRWAISLPVKRWLPFFSLKYLSSIFIKNIHKILSFNVLKISESKSSNVENYSKYMYITMGNSYLTLLICQVIRCLYFNLISTIFNGVISMSSRYIDSKKTCSMCTETGQGGCRISRKTYWCFFQ